jgi:Flp pilus assembly protein TadD
MEVFQIFSKPAFLCLLLFTATLLVFWPVLKCDFVNYDDPDYFSSNPHVVSGLKADNIIWAFTTSQTGNWHPLTWLSLMLDAELFDPANPAGPHLTNLLFHGFNVVLLFLLLQRLAGTIGPSVCVAALFAWHPLHVESVAWISERKDVLSTFFGLLALLSYQRYTQASRRAGYWLALVFFELSLMAKPMLVTLPFVLLLLDWWPIGRLSLSVGNGSVGGVSGARVGLKCVLLEKMPFFVLSLISGIVTFIVQKQGGAVASLANVSISERIQNGFVGYIRYLDKTVWPSPLANPYPLVRHWELSFVIFSVVLVVGLSALAILVARRFPYFFTGWFWFLVTLIPVIGLIQVGIQSMADRYTYFPLIGVSIIFAWGLSRICAQRPFLKMPVAILTLMILGALVLQARTQLGYWKNNETLFRHTLAVTTDNYLAYNNLGTWLSKNGHLAEALDCFQKSARINPSDPEVRYNLANTFSKLGNWNEAINNYEFSLQLKPEQADVLANLGLALVEEKQYTNAISCFVEALKLKPDSAEIHNNLATVLFIGHEFGPAEEQFRAALALTPGNPQVYANLGDTLVRENKVAEAAQFYQKALDLDPENEKIKLKLQSLVK